MPTQPGHVAGAPPVVVPSFVTLMVTPTPRPLATPFAAAQVFVVFATMATPSMPTSRPAELAALAGAAMLQYSELL